MAQVQDEYLVKNVFNEWVNIHLLLKLKQVKLPLLGRENRIQLRWWIVINIAGRNLESIIEHVGWWILSKIMLYHFS